MHFASGVAGTGRQSGKIDVFDSVFSKASQNVRRHVLLPAQSAEYPTVCGPPRVFVAHQGDSPPFGTTLQVCSADRVIDVFIA